MEQSITQPESAAVLERVWQVSHDLLLAVGRTQDMRLGDAVRRRIPESLYATEFPHLASTAKLSRTGKVVSHD